MFGRSLLVGSLVSLWCCTSPAAEVDVNLEFQEKVLRDASVPADGPGLLAYLKAQTLSDDDRVRLAVSVTQLGDKSFRVREKAYQQLVKAGRQSLLYLKDGLNDKDAEVRARAERAIQEIERVPVATLQSAIAQVLAIRRPAGAVPALLAHLPAVSDADVEDTYFEALATPAFHKDQLDPAITAAVADRDAKRRAAAAHVLGRVGTPLLDTLRKMAKDEDAQVRFCAAEALIRREDREGAPVLIALLSEGPLPLAWRAEDLLARLAGDQSLPFSVGKGDEAARATCRKAWDAWWKDHGKTVKLAGLGAHEAQLGLTIIVELDGSGKTGSGLVWECGMDGKPRWELDAAIRPSDAQVIPGGRLLIAEHSKPKVTERERDGKELWSYTPKNMPVSCQRLPNGNTFIATYNEILEVTREGKEVYCYNRPHMIFAAQKLRDGTIVYVHSNGGVVELDSTGKELHNIPAGSTSGWGGVERLANRHYLVAQYSGNKVTEIDVNGKVYWEVSVHAPGYATRLTNGNTLVASIEGKFVAEYDRSGKEVWRQATRGRPFRVHRR